VKIKDILRKNYLLLGSLLEAEEILSYVLNVDKNYLYLHENKEIAEQNLEKIKKIVKRRREGVPLSYILKKTSFMGLDFYVDERVFIPRKETELLVEETIEFIKRSKKKKLFLLDVGTGSCCIPISVFYYTHKTKTIAIDKSFSALEVARRNVRKYSLKDDILLVCGDLFSPLNKKFDIVISNPPYVSIGEYRKVSRDVKKEPIKAFIAGKEGLDVIKRLIEEGRKFLLPDGILIFEIGYNQEEMIKSICPCVVKKDYAGIPRYAIVKNE
jgi:release factor glutamine methyltransferase